MINEVNDKAPHTVLKARRQELKLDIATVAGELRISSATIKALEAGAYELLPAKVFIRGYINSYCRLLDIDPEPILAEVGDDEKYVESKEVHPVVGNERLLKGIRVWGTLSVAVFVSFLVLWSSYFDGDDTQLGTIPEKPLVESAAEKEAPVPVQEEKPEVEIIEVDFRDTAPESVHSSPTSVEDSRPLGVSESLISSPRDERFPDAGFVRTPSSADTAATPTLVVPELGEVTLSIRSPQTCWAHIVDAAGKTLLHRTMLAGYENSFYGVAPFYVRLGNAEFVTLVIDGKTVPVVRHMRPTGTAKFKIFSADQIILQ